MSTQLTNLDKDVKRRIIQAARTVRKKYLALKLERSEQDKALDRFLTPITEPLNKLVTATPSKKRKIKTEPLKKEPELIHQPSIQKVEPPAQQQQQQPSIQKVESSVQLPAPETSNDNDVFEETDPSEQSLAELKAEFEASLRRPEVYAQFVEQYPKITQEYLRKYWFNSGDIDSNGLKYEIADDSWQLGSQPVNFIKNGDIKIGPITYKGTQGLYDLLFLKEPKYHTSNDEKEYADILKRTGIYFNDSGHLKGNRSRKYLYIIKPLLTVQSAPSKIPSPGALVRAPKVRSQSDRLGHALMEYNEKPKEFVYYDDVNELIERLKKLEASKQGGNNNNMNEIWSILHELERLGVIEFYK